MSLDLDKAGEIFDRLISNISKEDIEKYFKSDDAPFGWVSIDDCLPMMRIVDLDMGYSVYKVKDKYGKEFETQVTDHNIWYYMAKKEGITHWFNELK